MRTPLPVLDFVMAKFSWRSVLALHVHLWWNKSYLWYLILFLSDSNCNCPQLNFWGGFLQLPDWSSVFSRYGNPTNIIWNNATQFSTAGWASLLLKSRIQNNNRLWLRWLLVCNMCGALHATTATSPQQLLNNNKIHIFRIPKALAQRGHWWWCLIHDHLQGTGWVLEKPHTCNHFWYLSRRSPAKGWIDLVSRDSV